MYSVLMRNVWLNAFIKTNQVRMTETTLNNLGKGKDYQVKTLKSNKKI